MKKNIKSNSRYWILVDNSVSKKDSGYVDKTQIYLCCSCGDWMKYDHTNDVLSGIMFDSIQEAIEYVADNKHEFSEPDDIKICEVTINTCVKL